jgi:hypothetical protein
MKHDYFATVPADYTGYSVLTHSHGKRVTVLKGTKVVTCYADIPRGLIRQVAEYKGLYCHGEMSYHTGREVYKVERLREGSTGVIGLFSSESRAAYNRFIIETAQ